MTEQQNLHQMAQQDPSVRVQQAMLRMAQNMMEQGHVHTAADTYIQLIEQYPGTDAARAAASAVADLGQYMEEHGMPHNALELYRKLEELQDLL